MRKRGAALCGRATSICTMLFIFDAKESTWGSKNLPITNASLMDEIGTQPSTEIRRGTSIYRNALGAQPPTTRSCLPHSSSLFRPFRPLTLSPRGPWTAPCVTKLWCFSFCHRSLALKAFVELANIV